MLIQVIHASGGSYLEAPVSGSKQPAEQVCALDVLSPNPDHEAKFGTKPLARNAEP